MRKRILVLLGVSAVLAVAAWVLPPLFVNPRAGEPVGKRPGGKRAEAQRRIRRVEAQARVRRIILDTYVEKVAEQKIFYGSLRGMVRELDPHSQFLSPEEYADLSAATTGEFGGLGIEVTQRDGWLTVVTPLVGTPAFRAGVLPGDRIVKIDGEATDRLSLAEAVHKMRGKPGTRIVLGIVRRGAAKVLDIEIVRRKIKVDSVRIPHFVDEKNRIAYVSLTAFQADSAEELVRALKKLEKQGLRALVLDLRANGGGRMDAAVKVADLFISKGLIVSTRGRPTSRRDNVPYRARKAGTRPDYPLAVLVNQSSASASEIVAGALRDHHRAILVGEKTFGKASVQTLREIRIGKDKAGLKLTTAYYYTPSGQLIHKKGIAPDVKVPMKPQVLAEVFRKQHDEWVKLNAPEKKKPGAEKDPAPEKKPEPGNKPEPARAPEKKGAEDGKKKPEAVDTQLKAAVRALRAVLIDRARTEGVGKPAPPTPKPVEAPEG